MKPLNKSIKKFHISVIIPTYNRAWILEDTIKSVLMQEYKNFELIIVDDGSSDNTDDILTLYKDKIKVIKQENKGVSAARNVGIKASKGKYIAFLDSDDLWLKDKLCLQVNFFNENPKIKICQTDEIWIRNGIRVNPKKRHKKYDGMIFDQSLELCLVSPSAVMIKKSLFNEIGLFDEKMPACEDYDLWLRVACKYPVSLIKKACIIKRGGHNDQLSKMDCLDKYRIYSLKKIIEKNILNCDQKDKAIKTLLNKCKIYAQGCKKRGRDDEYDYYIGLINFFN